VNLALLTDRLAEQNPTASAISGDAVEYSRAGLRDAVALAASRLQEAGVSAGDVVAVMLPNTASFVVAMFAAWRLGAAVTPINPTMTGAEVGYQIADAGAGVLISEAVPDYEVSSPVVLTPADLAAGAVTVGGATEVPDDALALLIYTSGTTGRPKGVMLDHANLAAMCSVLVDNFELTERDRSLLILPLFHVNGIVIGTLSPLLAGGSAVIAGRFSPKSFFDRLEDARPTYFSAVPAIYTMLADLPTDVAPDTSSVRFGICGAAPASVELLEKFQGRYGIPLIEGYGLSEGTCVSFANPLHGIRKQGSVGLPLAGQSVRIVDAGGAEVPAGESGEVLIKGANVMRGYLNRPEETERTVVDGWLHTGDVGRLDDDGYLYLVDRAKDMIIRGGENIYPKEIEAVVYQLPEIAEAAVVGRPHQVLGEEPVLFVSLNSGAELSPDAIAEHLRAVLSKFKHPAQITILDDLPKNPVGKIHKPRLRERVAENR